MPVDMEVVRTREVAVVHCDGRLVLGESTSLLRDAVRQAFSAGQDIVLDLSRVTHVDAHGAGVLAGLCERAREEGCGLALVRTSGRVRCLLRVTGLDAFMRSMDGVERGSAEAAAGSFPAHDVALDAPPRLSTAG